MWKIAFRGFRASFGRFILTLLSVALGVAFLGTTLALKDGIGNQFQQLNASVSTDDLYVVGEKVSDDEMPVSGVRTRVPDDLVDALTSVKGVAYAEPMYQLTPQLRDTKGQVIGEVSYAPTILIGQKKNTKYAGGKLVDGHWAHAKNEIVMEEGSAKAKKLHVGDKVQLVFDSTKRDVTIVGIVNFGTSMAGATVLFLPSDAVKDVLHDMTRNRVATAVRKKMESNPQLQQAPPAMRDTIIADAVKKAEDEAVAKPIDINAITVDIDKGQSLATVKANVERAIDSTWKDYDISQRPVVLTRAQNVEEQNESINSALGYVNLFLLVFVGIALFVGSFIISNTFRMIVASQKRQFAMLRAIGVSVAQIFSIVIVQGLLLGIVGSAIGIGLAFLVKKGILALIVASGLKIDSLPLSGTNIAIAIAVGLGVTMIGAIIPARSAAKIPPVEAMRSVDGANEKSLLIPTIIGLVLVVGGVALMYAGAILAGNNPGILLAVGVVAFLIGILVITPALSRPVVWFLAWPLRIFRPSGLLAMRNVIRNPKRTAATASALTIGVALVTLGSVMAASMKDATASIVDEQVKADLIVASQTNSDISDSLVDKISAIKGVSSVNASMYFGPINVKLSHNCTDDCFADAKKKFATCTSSDPAAIGRDFTMPVDKGNITPFIEQKTPYVLLDKTYAKDNNLHVNDKVLLIGSSKSVEARVAATVTSQVISTDYIITPELADQIGMGTKFRALVLVRVDKASDIGTIQKKMMDIFAKDQPLVAAFTKEQYKDMAAEQVNIMLAIIYALLGLSIVIAILGIVNTQSMSVRERIRELGLLRASGFGRAHVSFMVILESILVSIFGSVLGFLTGVGVSRALFEYMINKDLGLEHYIFPMESIAMMVIGGVVIGVIAGIVPSIRAARIPVLTAVSHVD